MGGDGVQVQHSGKAAVFHVGAHKTGTTLLQQYLISHQRRLARRGIQHVSRADLTPSIGWGEVLLREPERLGAHLTAFRRNPWYRVFVASHENILGHPFVRGGSSIYPAAADHLEALASVLHGFRPKIVVTVRPQHEMLESYYLQSVKLGSRHRFSTWLSRIDLAAISWRPLVTTLHERFGADHVEVVDFGLIRQGQEQYLRHVLGRMHLRLDREVEYAHAKNFGLSGRGLELSLAAQPLLQTAEERLLLRQFLQRYFSNGQQPRPVLLTPAQRADLAGRYADEYAGLFAGATR
jgi:hypothetical protein